MLRFNKEDTRKEKLIIIGLWVIALYFIVGTLFSAVTMQFNSVTGGFGILFLILGIGLVLEKGWALQITAIISFMIILSSLAVFFSYLDGGNLELDEIREALVMLLLAMSIYFIVTHTVSMQIYEVDFKYFNKVKSTLYWTLGVGFLGFCISLLYMFMYVDGVYRGFVVVYGTMLFVGLGFIMGVFKALRMK